MDFKDFNGKELSVGDNVIYICWGYGNPYFKKCRIEKLYEATNRRGNPIPKARLRIISNDGEIRNAVTIKKFRNILRAG